MKRVLLDLNILLDVLLDRRPHSESSLALWAAALRAEVQVLFPAHGVTTVFYVTARQTGVEVLRIFHGMHERGETIVIVTHDPRIAEQCERVVQIVDGRIEDDRTNG